MQKHDAGWSVHLPIKFAIRQIQVSVLVFHLSLFGNFEFWGR